MTQAFSINRPLAIVAALLGAVGVGTAARASHGGLADLAIAANFMLLHAPVFLFLSLLRGRAVMVASGVLLAGLVLFAGDLTMLDLAGHALFPFAAPTGGIGLMAGWLLIGIVALTAHKRD